MQRFQCWNVPGILRLIQSIPSPKAEPFKRWLAKVGYERLREIADPALALERTRENWRRLGRSEKWITQRMTGQETRNKLTDYWTSHDVKQGQEFAILTNIIHEEWSGVTVKEHKEMKGLASKKRMRISRASETRRALVLESGAGSNVAIQSGRINNGLESLRRRDFKMASNPLTTSFLMNHSPETAYFLAKAEMGLGEWNAAIDHL